MIRQLRSAGGVLFKDGKVLLIHWEPPRSSYDFPKGGIKLFESPESACVREVYEETGYKTKTLAPIDTTEYEYIAHDGRRSRKTVKYFLLELTDERAYPTRRAKYETFDNAWVPIDEAYALITRDVDKALFRSALKCYTET